jgi:short-subunit dehydrogenase
MRAGKTYVVTGAVGGIGRKLVEKLARERASVWALDYCEQGLRELADEASKSGAELRTLCVDLRDSARLNEAVRQVLSKTPKVDVWINNAGISGAGDFLKASEEDFESLFQVNFMATVQTTRLVLGHMETRGSGTIVNVASIAGFVPAPYLVGYSASKHAVVGFTRALREELRLRDSPIRLVLVSPGFVNTPMIHGTNLQFPSWLRWTLSSADQVAAEIVKAATGKSEEVMPTWNGKLMQALHLVLPGTTRRNARLLLTDTFGDWLSGRYRLPE